MADTGFKFPTTTTDGGTGFGYASRDNVKADDGAVADGNTSNPELYAHTFAFGVPAGATIDGIEFEIQHRDTCGDGSYSGLVAFSWDRGGDPATNETADQTIFSGTNPGSTFTEHTVGGPTSTFSRTWSASDFSDANFRLRMQHSLDSFPYEYEIDYIRMKIYYTAAGGAAGKANPMSGPMGGPMVGPLG